MRIPAFLVLAVSLLPDAAMAQGFPSRPVRIVVPFPAGGTVDTVARTFGQKMTENWKQPVIVENRAGAGGNIGADAVAKAGPDGYTMLLTIHGIAISASLYRKLPFDPVKDVAPVIQLTSSTQALVVNPNLPARSVRELVALAKAQPGKLAYASAGIGAPNHLYGELLKSLTGIDILHVPYKGDVAQTAALMAGDVQMAFMPVNPVLPQVKAGKLRALAVTSSKRSQSVADIPTMAEQGVADFDLVGWLGVFSTAGAPRDVIGRLNAEANRILGLPDIRERLPGWGYEGVGGTVEDFADRYRADIAKYAKIIREASIPMAD
jgi:tripartite-type tricarboxylate transporter receptor subunit TctC